MKLHVPAVTIGTSLSDLNSSRCQEPGDKVKISNVTFILQSIIIRQFNSNYKGPVT